MQLSPHSAGVTRKLRTPLAPIQSAVAFTRSKCVVDTGLEAATGGVNAKNHRDKTPRTLIRAIFEDDRNVPPSGSAPVDRSSRFRCAALERSRHPRAALSVSFRCRLPKRDTQNLGHGHSAQTCRWTSPLSCSRRFGFPHGMTLIALALGGFLLGYSHCRRISAKQGSSPVESPLVKSLGS